MSCKEPVPFIISRKEPVLDWYVPKKVDRVNFEPVLLLTRNVAQTEPVRLLQRPFFCRSCQFRTGSELTRSTIFGACQSGTGSLCFRGRINSGTGSYFGGTTDFNKNIIGTGSRIRGINERPQFQPDFLRNRFRSRLEPDCACEPEGTLC